MHPRARQSTVRAIAVAGGLVLSVLAGAGGGAGGIAPDALRGLQWNLDAVNATGAWSQMPGFHPVVLAVIDSGADLTHVDLALQFWDGNALHGTSTARPFGVFEGVPLGPWDTTFDDDGHGTAVAGVAVATRGNAAGIAGVADVWLMVVKIGGMGAFTSDETLAEGMRWAVDHGAHVVLTSQALQTDRSVVASAVAHAEASGVVVVAAAGNTGTTSTVYPAGYPTVVSVGATDAAHSIASFSTRGKVDLVAPGVEVLTTHVGNLYAEASGTSFAAPHVAGAAALVVAADPSLTPAAVRAHLNATARDLGPPGHDTASGHGLLDAGAAVALALGVGP